MVGSAQASRWGLDIPFVRALGFELLVFEQGVSELRYVPQPEHHNSFDTVHGGALMTLLDAAMAVAARNDPQQMGLVTIEMKTSFMQPARGALRARGELVHRTATLAFTQASVYNQDGALCANATATYKYVQRLALGRKIKSPAQA